MDGARFEDSVVDAAQKALEFLGPMARQALTDHHAGLYIKRREQCGRAVALVVVRHHGCTALLERQSRLGAVKRLNLRLFVSAKHDSAFRWI
jgi:hypothetical protein